MILDTPNSAEDPTLCFRQDAVITSFVCHQGDLGNTNWEKKVGKEACWNERFFSILAGLSKTTGKVNNLTITEDWTFRAVRLHLSLLSQKEGIKRLAVLSKTLFTNDAIKGNTQLFLEQCKMGVCITSPAFLWEHSTKSFHMICMPSDCSTQRLAKLYSSCATIWQGSGPGEFWGSCPVVQRQNVISGRSRIEGPEVK